MTINTVFIGFVALLTVGASANTGLIQTVKGTVVSSGAASFDLQTDRGVLTIAKDALSPVTNQDQLKPGDEVEISYVRELREVRSARGQKPGKVPESQPPRKPKPMEDDRIFQVG